VRLHTVGGYLSVQDELAGDTGSVVIVEEHMLVVGARHTDQSGVDVLNDGAAVCEQESFTGMVSRGKSRTRGVGGRIRIAEWLAEGGSGYGCGSRADDICGRWAGTGWRRVGCEGLDL
jgi:hypothetical protein